MRRFCMVVAVLVSTVALGCVIYGLWEAWPPLGYTFGGIAAFIIFQGWYNTMKRTGGRWPQP